MIVVLIVVIIHHIWNEIDDVIYNPYVLTGIVLGILGLIWLFRRPWHGSQSFEKPLPRVGRKYRGIDDPTRRVKITGINTETRLVWYSLDGVEQRGMNARDFFHHYRADSSEWFTIAFVLVGTLAVALLVSTEFGGPDYHNVIDWLGRAADTFLDQLSGLPGIRQMR